MKQIFKASQFVPTKWSSAADKAKFANHLIDFIGDWRYTKFPKWFYTRLSLTFGNIAHYNKDGFYYTWFDKAEDRSRFIQKLLNYPCYGDPEYTYSDVEKAVQNYLREIL